MSSGFTGGGILGCIIGVFICIASGFYDGFVGFGIGGFIVGGIIGSAIQSSNESSNINEAQNRISDISDSKLKEKIQEIKSNIAPFTEPQIKDILNAGDIFLSLKYTYNEKNYYTWLLKNDKAQTVQITQFGESPEFPNISLKEISASEQTYHPEQLIYTGATVGGVSMGGFHTQEAYISEKFKSSGKYGLYLPFIKPDVPYYDKNSKTNIKIDEIYLSDSLTKKVPQELKTFLKEQKLVLKHENISESKKFLLESAIKSGNPIIYNKALQDFYFETQLTKSECQSIINWISGLF